MDEDEDEDGVCRINELWTWLIRQLSRGGNIFTGQLHCWLGHRRLVTLTDTQLIRSSSKLAEFPRIKGPDLPKSCPSKKWPCEDRTCLIWSFRCIMTTTNIKINYVHYRALTAQRVIQIGYWRFNVYFLSWEFASDRTQFTCLQSWFWINSVWQVPSEKWRMQADQGAFEWCNRQLFQMLNSANK